MALDSFNELLHKLKLLHERELEGWQERVLELTNQKCCDTKRMEELFNKNQQLREQQRALTENIKQLENRLRAGLCDRCTVTQDVAKRKQQEYESLQIQSLQHISVLVSEMNTLRKENKRLQEEVKNLRGMIEGPNGHGPQVSPPELGTEKAGRVQPQSCQTPLLAAVKTDPDSFSFLSAEEKLQGCRKPQGWTSQESYVPNKLRANPPSISPGRRAENMTSKASSGVKRARSMDTIEPLHPPSSPSQPSVSPLLLLKSFPPPVSSSASASTWDEKLGSHLIQTPVIYRPRPIKTTCLPLPYNPSDHPDWAALMSSSAFMDRKLLDNEHLSSEGVDKPFHSRGRKRSPELFLNITQPPSELPSTGDALWKRRAAEKEAPPSLWKCSNRAMDKTLEKPLPEGAGEAPLDLSDPRRFQPSKRPKDKLSPFLPEEDPEEAEGSHKLSALKTPPQTRTSPPSSGSALPLPAAVPSPPRAGQLTSPSEGPPLHVGKDQQEEELNAGKEERISPKNEQKKLPVLPISLRPVVVLETMKEGTETRESSDKEVHCCEHGSSQMPMDLHPEIRLGDPLEENHSSPERSQNGRRRRGLSLGRDAVLHRRSPKDRRGKLALSQGDVES